MKLRQQVHTTAIRELNVQKNDIWQARPDRLAGFGDAATSFYDVAFVSEPMAKQPAHRRVIIYE
ncbi:MAG: hypothetical protein ACJAZO_002669 [Myxococcota bacterium]|jgi:hypothetical protein